MEATQQVEEIEQSGIFVKTVLDLRRFVIESQMRYLKKRGIAPGSDAAKDHLDLVESLLTGDRYCCYLKLDKETLNRCRTVFHGSCFVNFLDIYKKSKEKGSKILFNTDMLGLPVHVSSDKMNYNVFGIVANSFLYMLSYANDPNITFIKQAMQGFHESQDLFHAMVEETHCVYNEKNEVHYMNKSNFGFCELRPDVLFGYEPVALAVMIRCGVSEKTTSLYCKKLAGSVSCFGEQYKDSLSFNLVKGFLVQYFGVEDDNKKVFWCCFKTLLQETGFEVNSRVRFDIWLCEKKSWCYKQSAFIFPFLDSFKTKISVAYYYYNCVNYVNYANTKDDIVICVLTELIIEHGLDIEVLDYESRDLHTVLSTAFDKEHSVYPIAFDKKRMRRFIDLVRTKSPNMDSPNPNHTLCLCKYHRHKLEERSKLAD